MTQAAHASLEDLLCASAATDLEGPRVVFSGHDDLYPTRFRSGHVTGVALAAAALASRPTGEIKIDLDHAALISEGYRHVLRDGAPVAAPRDPLTGFYETADRRYLFLHVNFPHHRERALAVLQAEGSRASLESKIATWSMAEADVALAAAGAICAPVLSADEWRQNTQRPPLIDIEKVAESTPRPADPARVVDFTRVLAGPTCGRFLAETGAIVTRIDNPLYPDLLSYRLDANRDKKEESLDLRDAKQKARLFQLIDEADVFLQAYRPGVAEKLGLGAQTLCARNPGLIHASLSAYDDHSAFAGRRGFDSAVQATSGIALLNGQGTPKLLSTSPLDYCAGFLLAFGVKEALRRRTREGGSYIVRTSLARVATWLLDMQHATAPIENKQRMVDLISRYRRESVTASGTISHIASAVF